MGASFFFIRRPSGSLARVPPQLLFCGLEKKTCSVLILRCGIRYGTVRYAAPNKLPRLFLSVRNRAKSFELLRTGSKVLVYPGLFTGHDPSHGVGSGGFQNTAVRVGLGHEVSETSRVGSGLIRRFLNLTNHPDPIRPARNDPTREK